MDNENRAVIYDSPVGTLRCVIKTKEKILIEIICPKCGTVSKKDAVFCTNCGTQIKETPKTTDKIVASSERPTKDKAALSAAHIAGICKAIEFFYITPDYIQELSDSEIPLIQAVINNDQEMLTALLEAGADVDQTDDNGNTALMTAAENGNDKMAEILLSYNADIDIENDYDEDAITIARDNGKRHIITLLNKAR